jgi:signal transduction histidine kinase
MEEVLAEARRARPPQGEADPIAVSEAEEALEAWMDDQGIERAWVFAPSLAEGGFTVLHLERIASHVPESALTEAVTWTTQTLIIDESTEIIAQSSQRINDLVQSIKGYSYMDRATEHDGDIHEGIENTLIILAHRLRNVEVHRQYDRSLPPIRMYGNTLNQVWTNILDNAIDAIDGKGRIAIKTSSGLGEVIVEIEDNGTGIPGDDLPRIFEPFFTSKPQGQGTGLGLDTAWRIVTQEHAGSISAISEPGRTVFRVSLPVTLPLASEGTANQ